MIGGCPSAEADLKVASAYKARMEARDSSDGFGFEAIYGQVQPHEVLELVMADGRRFRTIFEPAGSGTKVTTVFDAEAQNSIDVQRNGWQAILDNFRAYVESERISL
ncbi:SRPBCC domain-containing protein [Microbulbifer sp. 2201CG32-9]|uniref:SRPBCC domain-containing protein n=1 Tax=Microbulbifer sp. 2201CG32-9 TaxID=3232309 RepID=UPI00345B9DA2